MTLGAWITLIFGVTVLYGGLFTCISIAIKRKNN